jgi:hypothetical protein
LGLFSQFQDLKEHVIAYGTIKLTVAQSAYYSTKGEMAAAIIYFRKWKYYLQHRQFILQIDNAAMQWICTMVEPVQGMVQRWLQTLAKKASLMWYIDWDATTAMLTPSAERRT